MPANKTNKYAPTSWGDTAFDFECPSGQLCRMQKVDVDALLRTGLMGKLDSLSGIVEGLIPKPGKAPKQEDAMEIAKKLSTRSAEDLAQLTGLVNVIVQEAVIEPKLSEFVNCGEDEIYVGRVSFGDRMAIFNKALEDTANLQQFRGVGTESLDSVVNVAGVSHQAE